MAALAQQLFQALPKGWESSTRCSQLQQWQRPQGEWQTNEWGHTDSQLGGWWQKRSLVAILLWVRVLKPLLQQVSRLGHQFWGCNSRIRLYLEERRQQVTRQLWSKMAAAAQIRETHLCFWCPSGGNYREGRRGFVAMTKKIITVEATVCDKLAFNIIWGRKPCTSLSPSSSVFDQRWKPSRRWN